MRERRLATVGLVLAVAGVLSAQDAACAANIRNHIEAVRRSAAVVYLGVVGDIELSERRPVRGLDARAGVRVLFVARSPVDATPPTVTLEYPTWDDTHPPYAGDGQYRLDPGSLVAVFADSWGGRGIRYLLQGDRDQLLEDLLARHERLLEMSGAELKRNEIDEDDRRAQLELYRLLASALE